MFTKLLIFTSPCSSRLPFFANHWFEAICCVPLCSLCAAVLPSLVNKLQFQAQHPSPIELRRRDANPLECVDVQKSLCMQNTHHAGNWAVQVLEGLGHGAAYLHHGHRWTSCRAKVHQCYSSTKARVGFNCSHMRNSTVDHYHNGHNLYAREKTALQSCAQLSRHTLY